MIIRNREMNGGMQIVHRFENGFGASVVKGPYSYGGSDGLWELAVIEFDGDSDDYDLTYDTPIADDVIGYLTDDKVAQKLAEIEALPEKDKED